MFADFHMDYLTEGKGTLKDISKNADYMVCALFRGKRNYGQVQKYINKFIMERRENQFLGLEDVGYLRDEREEEALFNAHPVYASLTWNYENELAGGCYTDIGLKKEGACAVEHLIRRGIYIDCAHLSRSAFKSVLDITDKVVNSHTCSNAIFRHPRNIEDWQAKEIAQRGGLIGVTFVRAFLALARGTVHDVFAHIDHFVQICGIDHVCIGSDFYGTKDLPENLTNYRDVGELESFACKAGYDKESQQKIFYKNLQNFLLKNTEA